MCYAAIEDDPQQAAAFAAIGTQCYVFAHLWNRVVEPSPYIQRVRDWSVIERALVADAGGSKAGTRRRPEGRPR